MNPRELVARYHKSLSNMVWCGMVMGIISSSHMSYAAFPDLFPDDSYEKHAYA
jgi:hypothetical protein